MLIKILVTISLGQHNLLCNFSWMYISVYTLQCWWWTDIYCFPTFYILSNLIFYDACVCRWILDNTNLCLREQRLCRVKFSSALLIISVRNFPLTQGRTQCRRLPALCGVWGRVVFKPQALPTQIMKININLFYNNGTTLVLLNRVSCSCGD